jgi:ATP/maltotriose-dependent transcriptional regulator MalT
MGYPAGFAKTTLLAECAHAATHSVERLSLDEGDSDPGRFWRYIAAALDRASIQPDQRIGPLAEGRTSIRSRARERHLHRLSALNTTEAVAWTRELHLIRSGRPEARHEDPTRCSTFV